MSTDFITWAKFWRRVSESNRGRRICNLHGHSATRPTQSSLFVGLILERETRLELATPTLARSCSTNWAIPAFSLCLISLLVKPNIVWCAAFYMFPVLSQYYYLLIRFVRWFFNHFDQFDSHYLIVEALPGFTIQEMWCQASCKRTFFRLCFTLFDSIFQTRYYLVRN